MAERKTYTAEDFVGKLGRNVLVAGEIVDCFPDDGRHVTVCFGDGRWRVLASAIVEILPEEIKVGDRVKWRAGDVAEVLAVHDGRAWVLYESGARDDWPLSDLTLVERG